MTIGIPSTTGSNNLGTVNGNPPVPGNEIGCP
jgi:hypothetical protein